MRSLLRLPGEIRNQIYDHIAEDEVFVFQSDKNSFSVSPPYRSQMCNADDQILNEYISAASTSAAAIQTTVYDFDFSHVAAFLDSLSGITVKTLDNNSKRRFIIKLEITENFATTSPQLTQWLARFAQGSQGCGIRFEYKISRLYMSHFTEVFSLEPWLMRSIECHVLEAQCMESEAEACRIELALVDSHAHIRAHRRKVLDINRQMPHSGRG